MVYGGGGNVGGGFRDAGAEVLQLASEVAVSQERHGGQGIRDEHAEVFQAFFCALSNLGWHIVQSLRGRFQQVSSVVADERGIAPGQQGEACRLFRSVEGCDSSHAEVIGEHHALVSQLVTQEILDHDRGERGGKLGIQSGGLHMGHHDGGKLRHERGERRGGAVVQKSAASSRNGRQGEMRIALGCAHARKMLAQQRPPKAFVREEERSSTGAKSVLMPRENRQRAVMSAACSMRCVSRVAARAAAEGKGRPKSAVRTTRPPS